MTSRVMRLTERKFVQWMAAYFAAAWFVLEAFDTLREYLGWPAALFPVVLATLAFGAVICAVVAWYHGEKGNQRVSGLELLINAVLFVAGATSEAACQRSAVRRQVS